MTTAEYARLEERILARDQLGASQALYGLLKQGRPLTEITSETVRIHAPYTHVPYHQRLDDGMVKFVNNDHCLLSERVGLPLSSIWRVSVANCSLSAVSPPRVLSVNDVSHLAGIEVGTGAPSLDP